MKNLLVFLISAFLLTGLAIQKKNASPNTCMTTQEANEYMLRNLQTGHIQFYSSSAVIEEMGKQILVNAQEPKKSILTYRLAIMRQLVKYLHSH